MKLHLPVSLFAALMAVLTALPSFADVTVKKGEESVELTETYEEPEGGAKGYSYDFGTVTDDVTITITGEGKYSEFKLGEGTTQLRGNTDIDVTGKCYWEGKGGSNAGLACQGGSATINVHDGGLFVNSGYIGWSAKGSTAEEPAATINVSSGGTFQDLGGSYAYNSGDKVAINVNEGGTFLCGYEDPESKKVMSVAINSGAFAKINITGGTMRSAGRWNASSNFAEGYKKGGTVEFTVGKGENGQVGLFDFSATDIDVARYGKASITVNDGGIFKVGQGEFSYESGSTEITVNKGGEFYALAGPQSGWTIFTYTNNGGSVTITVDGGKFIAEKAHFGYSNRPNAKSSITVKNGGSYREEGDGAAFNYVTITVGKDSSFEIHDGGASSSSQASMDNCEVVIDGGTFLFTNEETDEHPRADIDGSNRFVLRNGGTIDVGQAFVDASYSYDWGINPNLTIEGGNLVNARKMSGDCTINIDRGYTGVNSLGGLLPKYITEFKVNGANTWFNEIGDGTITLQGGDSITLGAESVWQPETGEENTTNRHAAFQFENSEKGTVDVNGQFVLHFDGSGILFKAAEDGTITIEVFLTNGKFEGKGEEWAKEHFVAEKGWGLEITGYDAQDGILTLTGKLNVWDAVTDGDDHDGTHHASANAGDLTGFDKVIIDENTTLSANEDATLKQLEGNSRLEITNEDGGEKNITLQNEGTPTTPEAGHTTFEGDISAAPGVNLKKEGGADLTIGGNLKVDSNLAVNEGGLSIEQRQDENGNTVGGNLTVGGALTVGDAEVGTEGTLDVQGNLNAQDVNVQNGELTLNGENNFIDGALTVGGTETRGTLDVQGNLDAKDVNVQNGKLTFGENSESSIGGELTLGDKGALQVDGKLTLSGVSDLSEGSDKLSGSGTIEVSGEDGSLTFGDETMADESELKFKAVDGGTLNYTGSAGLELSDLTGNGHYTGSSFLVNGDGSGEEQVFGGTVNGKLSLGEGNYNLTNPNNGGCDLEVGSGSSATLAAGSTYHSIDNNGTLSTSTSEETGDVCITAEENIIFRNYAHSPVRIDLSEPDLSEGSSVKEINYKSTAGKIIIEHETELDVTLTGNILDAKGDLNVVIMEAAGGIENHGKYKEQAANYKMKTVRFMAEPQAEEDWKGIEAVAVVAPGEGVNEAVMNQLYDVDNTTFWTKGGQLLTHIPQRTESPWEQYATTANSRAGLGLLYRELHQNGVMEADQDVVELINGIDGLVESNPAEARRALAAVAGSTLTSVSAAQSAALRNQMGRVRDHALQAARLRCADNADEATAQQRPCKNSHVWVEGTGFFSEQHSVGDESGYRLNSWGGAVGIDAQVDAHWSVGVSLSASYGDLEAHAADDAKGDLDTYTVSFWSQAKNGRWGNTLLFTLGTNEADLKRTVNYGAGSYTATSNASGSSLGAMWELTYDFHPVKDNKSSVLQPLFNVAVMHTSMDGFSEKNAGNVGLAAEKQTRDTMTLGLGLRWLAAINSAKAVNRTVSTEVHANVAQDLGDRRSVANVALLADPNFTQSVYGSKAGSTAFQFGAGVNVPVTPNSQIYVNAGGELREHANAWNAALGVRMGF